MKPGGLNFRPRLGGLSRWRFVVGAEGKELSLAMRAARAGNRTDGRRGKAAAWGAGGKFNICFSHFGPPSS